MPAELITSRAIIGRFFRRLEQGPHAWVNSLSFRSDSDQASETYAWLGQSPQMREWIGGRQAKGLSEFSFTIDNNDYESTLEFKTKELRRDKSGQVMVRIDELADRAQSHPAKLMTTLIENGESSVCYDGQFFFDTDHTEGDSGTQSNDITFNAAVPTAPTAAEMRTAILNGITQMLGLKDDAGEPMNELASNFTVMTPVSLWPAAAEAITLPTVDTGGANLIPNLSLSIQPVANARLSWTDKIGIFRSDGNVKPFILQEEDPLDLKAQAEGSPIEFNEKKHQYGVEWSGNVGYGYWQHACLVTFN